MRLIINKTRDSIKTIFSLNDKPNSIAGGFALGSFIGMMPIPGFQVMVSLGISSLLRINRKAAIVAVFNTNIATGTFIFAFNFWLGKKILGKDIQYAFPDKIGFDFIKEIMNAGNDIFYSMVLGGVVTGFIVGVLSFILIKKYFSKKK